MSLKYELILRQEAGAVTAQPQSGAAGAPGCAARSPPASEIPQPSAPARQGCVLSGFHPSLDSSGTHYPHPSPCRDALKQLPLLSSVEVEGATGEFREPCCHEACVCIGKVEMRGLRRASHLLAGTRGPGLPAR